MKYLDAARVVLQKAGKPLHYKEITRLALDEKLVEPGGKTPEATMGAQLYLAVKRAEETGEAGEFRMTGRAHFALQPRSVVPRWETEVVEHNERTKGELLEFLHAIHPRQLELLVGQLLTAIGFDEVQVTRYSGDGGIDVDATLTVGGVTRVRTAIQVKRYRANVAANTVRELRGGLANDQRGLIITTAGFTKDAVSEAGAAGRTPISLIDGRRFVDLLTEQQIGVRRKTMQLLELNLAELLAGDDDDEGTGDKSAGLQSLPGGHEHYFETTLAFLDFLHAQPTLDEVVDWVTSRYEKVTKQSVVMAYLRAVLYAIGLCDFKADKVVLTDTGEELRSKRDKATLFAALRANVLGIDEILVLLAAGPLPVPAIREHLVEKLKVSWKTDHQVVNRLRWLEACGAVERKDHEWKLAAAAV